MTDLKVLVLEDDPYVIDQWGYVLPAFGIKRENAFVPMADKQRMRWCASRPLRIDKEHIVLAAPKDAEFIKGTIPMPEIFDQNTLMIFGPTHAHLTVEMLEDFIGQELIGDISTVYIPSPPTCQMDSVNAGAIFLYEYRRQHGWPDH